MEVHLTPELEARLDQLAADTGRAREEVVQDAVAGYFEGLAEMRQVLDRRYDDIESGRVKPIDGEEMFARLREKSNSWRRSHE